MGEAIEVLGWSVMHASISSGQGQLHCTCSRWFIDDSLQIIMFAHHLPAWSCSINEECIVMQCNPQHDAKLWLCLHVG
jgi:hypothetical protein